MFSAPPFWNRATWNAATTVEPHEKLSGSASVAWIAPPPEYGSTEIRRADELAVRAQAVERVRRDEISARAARDAIRAAAGDVDPVGASARADTVRPQAAEDQVPRGSSR